ncbi:hypothetical protein K504DRAFT_450226 [Pleomassaria siparia CBS 279.74]|uniref:Secreted protein n=1 Tax=Pleomassaria siparia CBS 279.74 TaxID=1314801 RepID=A0A6G1KM33_9PLEO|nr:hypothetical protein K504DRAFT_450226 [Pleomassaria siparia CBS 279.74]
MGVPSGFVVAVAVAVAVTATATVAVAAVECKCRYLICRSRLNRVRESKMGGCVSEIWARRGSKRGGQGGGRPLNRMLGTTQLESPCTEPEGVGDGTSSHD